jgi:hypothetical protein
MVIMTARLLQIVVGIAGLCALVLGLFIWIANIDLTDIHMLFGLLVTVGLLVMSIIALTARDCASGASSASSTPSLC